MRFSTASAAAVVVVVVALLSIQLCGVHAQDPEGPLIPIRLPIPLPQIPLPQLPIRPRCVTCPAIFYYCPSSCRHCYCRPRTCFTCPRCFCLRLPELFADMPDVDYEYMPPADIAEPTPVEPAASSCNCPNPAPSSTGRGGVGGTGECLTCPNLPVCTQLCVFGLS